MWECQLWPGQSPGMRALGPGPGRPSLLDTAGQEPPACLPFSRGEAKGKAITQNKRVGGGRNSETGNIEKRPLGSRHFLKPR